MNVQYILTDFCGIHEKESISDFLWGLKDMAENIGGVNLER